MQSEYTVILNEYICAWYWDGKVEASNFFTEEFKDIPGGVEGHLCLQHSKKQAGKRFASGFKHAIPNTLDWIAFLPTNVFHVSADALIANLISERIDDRALDYMTRGKGIGSFMPEMVFGKLCGNPLWTMWT